MAKPETPAETFHLVKLCDANSWNTVLLVPTSLLTPFAQLLAQITLMTTTDVGNGAQGLLDIGSATFTSEPFNPKKHVLFSKETELVQFKDYHTATVEMIVSAHRPSYGRLVCTLDEFRKAAGSTPPSTITE